MKLKKNHIVFTTIFIPRLLNDIYKNLIIHNHIEDTVIWVVGDKKTPIETKILCDEIKNKGLEVNYLNIEDQDEWGENYPQFYKIIPYNNETRRKSVV